MQENKVKRALRENRLALGTYVSFADPQIVEIIGLAGYDAAFIDMEHTTFDLGLITQMITAADLVGVTSMIRIPGNDENLILRLLDAGANGIIIPHIDGLEGATLPWAIAGAPAEPAPPGSPPSVGTNTPAPPTRTSSSR